MALSNPFAPRFAKVLFDIVLDTFADWKTNQTSNSDVGLASALFIMFLYKVWFIIVKILTHLVINTEFLLFYMEKVG